MGSDIIIKTVEYAKNVFNKAEAGHDWSHTYRVWKNAEHIAKSEGGDILVVSLAALLHDIADSKFHDGDESVGPRRAEEFLLSQKVEANIIDKVIDIIKRMSFKNELDNVNLPTFLELDIVKDADRLEAIGAVGIARAFSYGGYKGRPFFDEAITPMSNIDKETYKKSTAPTINHFYEKLLLLRSLMNTETAKQLAAQRHEYMISFLKQFYQEIHFEYKDTPFDLL